ncbi:MAG: sodium/solute symporter [Candidatus Thermoplasmatota archaeon]|nr:sodium/solute symporter [Candidatus Thermoplasmatota archaeon]
MIHWIDLTILATFLILIQYTGIYFSRHMKGSVDYFLASRSMPWYWIAMAVWATGIDLVHGFFAHGAAAYNWGIVQCNFEWIQGPFEFIVAGIFFVAFYWKSGVFTISEFLERRLSVWCRLIYTIVWEVFFIITVAAGLYLTALFLESGLGLNIWLGVLLMLAVSSIFTLVGGLSAVIMTDVVLFFLMILGTIPIYFILTNRFGEIVQIKDWMISNWGVSTEYFNLIPSAVHPYAPGPWIILGLCLVLAMGWSVAHQALIQRNLGARTVYDAKFGNIMSTVPKTFGAWLYMIPMALASVYFAADGIFVPKPDAAYGLMVMNILPVGLLGIAMVGLFSAGISTYCSVFNSCATMFVRDIYERFFVRDKPDEHYFRVGQITTGVVIVLSFLMVAVVMRTDLIMTFIQTMLSIFQGPFFAIILLAIFWKRTNGAGGTWGLILGALVTLALNLMTEKTFFEVAFYGFLATLVITIIVSLMTKPPRPDQVEGLTWGTGIETRQNVVEKRAGMAMPATLVKKVKYKVPWYKDIRIWSTIILLAQIVLLLYFAGV